MIAIVDYGVGNLFSMKCSLDYIGADCAVTADPETIRAAEKLILPGVGAFGDAISKLRATGLDQVVLEHAETGKSLLGICLGMQLLFERSFEYGEHTGLGLLEGAVVPLTQELLQAPLKIPHMGWNSLDFRRQSPLLKGIREEDSVYYVHSFFAPVGEYTAASSRYGGAEVSGLVQKDNVFGTQFHPEKSGDVGLAILRAFEKL
ncbi:MAG: imidazole glycerol phosphate synthase subunit HisH [Oscillospiraceae bacterium]